MSIKFCDNFSIYGGNLALMTNGLYAQVAGSVGNTVKLVNDPDGISPGKVLQIGAFFANEGYIRYIYSAPQAIMGQAVRMWLSFIPADISESCRIFEFRSAANAIIIYGNHNTIGGINVYDGAGTLLGSTDTPVITANAWWHHEVKIDTTAQTCEIRVEGDTVLSLDIPTIAGPLQQVTLHCIGPNGTPVAYYKDFVLWDGSGAQNTDFLGSVLVTTLLPTADVSLNWTPTPAGHTGASILANIPPQDGVQYLDAPNPPPAAYVCSLADLQADVTSVKCLMTLVRAAKTDGGDASLQIGIISSPSAAPATVLGTDRPITIAQTYWYDVFEQDPKTAAPWLPSAVNAAELQMNRTT